MLDRRSGGRLVDAWAGASLVRVGPRGYRDLIMLHGLTEIALLPYDPGSTTDAGIILDDHRPRRLRGRVEGEPELYQPAEDLRGQQPAAMSAPSSAARTAPTTPGCWRSPRPPMACLSGGGRAARL